MTDNDMTTFDHPRKFKVERLTSGVSWGSWGTSYHRTHEAAVAAAERFFRGEGHFGYLTCEPYLSTSEAFITTRTYAEYGRVFYPTRTSERLTARNFDITLDRPDVETAVEYGGHDRCNPMKSTPGCIVCDNHDNLHCARGVHCEHDGAANIGEWIGADYHTGHPKNESAYTFEFPTLPGVLFCEDCVGVIDDPATEPGTIVLTGEVSGIYWTVFADNTNRRRFDVAVSAADRTGGLSFEREVGSFSTLGAAVGYGRTEAERIILDEIDSEWAAGLHRVDA